MAETKGVPPSQDKLFWVQAIQEMRKDSVKFTEDAAKQLIALVSLLSGIYFHAVSFAKIPHAHPWTVKALFVGPLALWALSLLMAIMVFFPRRYEASPYSPDEAEATIMRMLSYKQRWLRASLILLLISLAWLVVAAWVYLDIYVAS